MSLSDIQSMKALKMAKDSTSKLPSYVWNTDKGLRNWNTTIAKGSDSVASVVILGDSITDASGDNTGNTGGYVGLFRTGIQLAYGMAGRGFSACKNFSYDTSWTLNTNAGTCLYQLKGTPASTSINKSDAFLTADLLYSTMPDGGTATVQLDGVNVGTINCNGATSYHNVFTVTASSLANHTIAILPATTGNTYIEGMTSYSGQSGVLIHRVGHFGIKASDYSDPKVINASISAFNPKLTIIMLGTNDNNQTSLANYQSSLDALVKQGLTTGDVLIMMMGDKQTQGAIPWSSYVAIGKQVAVNNNCAFLSLYDRWNSSFTWANNNGYIQADGTHPTTEGHSDIANALRMVLGGIAPEGLYSLVYETASWYGDVLLQNIAGWLRIKNGVKVVDSDGNTVLSQLFKSGNKSLLQLNIPSGLTYGQLNMGPQSYLNSTNTGYTTLYGYGGLVFSAQNGTIYLNGTMQGNASNRGINASVTSGATSIILPIQFYLNSPDNNFSVQATTNWNTTCWVTNKTTTSFTLNFGTAAPSGATVDWLVMR